MMVALFLSLPITAWALTGRSGEMVILEKEEIQDGNYYVAANVVEIYGTVNGDIFVAGDMITIDSENINGDVFAAGSNINIKGKINGSLRLVGEKININGEVSGNAMVAGQNLKLEPEAKLAGHLTFWGQLANVAGQVSGRVEGAMEGIRISGQVAKDLDLYLSSGPRGTIDITDGAQIGGTLYYQALQELSINKQAQIGGVAFNQIVKAEEPFMDRGKALAVIVKFFGMLIIGMLALRLLPQFFTSAYQTVYKKPFKVLLNGFLLLVVTPIACVLAAITVIGLPLAIITMILWAILLYLATILVAWFIGQFVKDKLFAKNNWPQLAVLALGILLFIMLKYLPFVGPLLVGILYILAWGTLTSIFKKEKN